MFILILYRYKVTDININLSSMKNCANHLVFKVMNYKISHLMLFNFAIGFFTALLIISSIVFVYVFLN